MENKAYSSKAKEPFTDYGHYTYEDYLSWQLDEMVELIKGKVFRQAAAPRVNHQRLSGKLFNHLFMHLKGKKCEVFSAPFDVRLPLKAEKNSRIETVVQPDLCVICDSEKLDEYGCLGAPDLIVEILSPGNNRKELVDKYQIYEASGVKEYWIIHPDECSLLIYSLVDGTYRASRFFTIGDVVESKAVEGFSLDLKGIFDGIEGTTRSS